MQVVCRATVRGMTWGNVALTLAVTWAAAMTAVVFVMAGAMREWKVRDKDRALDIAELNAANAARVEWGVTAAGQIGTLERAMDRINNDLVETTAGMNACALSLAEAMPAHTHEEIQHVGGRVEQLRDEVDKLSDRVGTWAAQVDNAVNNGLAVATELDGVRVLAQRCYTAGDQLAARLTALEQAPPPVIPEPVDVVGVLQAALAPWTRKDPPADQPSAQRADPDDTAAPDPSLIFDPTYDEYPEPVQVVDHVGLPVIPGLPIDIPVANWGLPG